MAAVNFYFSAYSFLNISLFQEIKANIQDNMFVI
jgi:hypothetical protein